MDSGTKYSNNKVVTTFVRELVKSQAFSWHLNFFLSLTRLFFAHKKISAGAMLELQNSFSCQEGLFFCSLGIFLPDFNRTFFCGLDKLLELHIFQWFLIWTFIKKKTYMIRPNILQWERKKRNLLVKLSKKGFKIFIIIACHRSNPLKCD